MKAELNELLKQFKNQKEMAAEIGVSAWVLGEYLSGKKEPSQHVKNSITLYCLQAGLKTLEKLPPVTGVYRLPADMANNIEKVANHLGSNPGDVVYGAVYNYLSSIIPAIDAGEEVL